MSRPPIAPGIYSTITDLSTYVEAVPSTIGFIAFVSDKGQDNKLVLNTARETAEKRYGKPNYDKYGTYAEGLLTAYNFMKQSPSMYMMRVLPSDAKFSHLAATFQKFNLEIGPCTFAVGNVKGGLSTLEAMETFLNTACGNGGNDPIANDGNYIEYGYGSSSSEDSVSPGSLPTGSGSVTYTSGAEEKVASGYGLLVWYPEGRGQYYDNYRLKLSPILNSEYVYKLDITVYNKETGEWEIKESLDISFRQDLKDADGESLFIEDVLEKYSDYIRCKVNDEYSFEKWCELIEGYITTVVGTEGGDINFTVEHIISSTDTPSGYLNNVNLGNKYFITHDCTTGAFITSDMLGKVVIVAETGDGDYAFDVDTVQPSNGSIIKESDTDDLYEYDTTTDTYLKPYTGQPLYAWDSDRYILIENVVYEDTDLPDPSEDNLDKVWFVSQNVVGEYYDLRGKLIKVQQSTGSTMGGLGAYEYAECSGDEQPSLGYLLIDNNKTVYMYAGSGVILPFDPFAYPFVCPLSDTDNLDNRRLLAGSEGSFFNSNGVLDSDAVNTALVNAYSGATDVGVIDKDNYYFSVVYDAGYPSVVKDAIASLATNLRRDCVSIIANSKDAKDENEEIKIRRTTHTYNSKYVALYCVGTKVYDEYNSRYRWVNPTYHMAQVIPYNDQTDGLYFAPAGYNRATLTGVQDIRYNAIMESKLEQLYLNQLNPIVLSDGVYLVYGELTSQRRPSALQSLKVVRTVLYIDTALRQYTKYYLWEQNDEITWKQVERDVVQFLETVKGERGLYGYSVEVSATEYEKKRKMFHVNLELEPTRAVEKIMLNYFIK